MNMVKVLFKQYRYAFLLIVLLLMISLLFSCSTKTASDNIAESSLHEVRESSESKILKFIVKLMNMKKSTLRRMEKGEGFINPKSEQISPDRKFLKKYYVKQDTIAGYPVYRISSLQASEIQSDLQILYLHGGAYMASFMPMYWDFIGTLVDRTGCTVIAPDYPLAPDAIWTEAWSMVQILYGKMIKESDPDNIVFMGDSAGGGFALALTQELRNLSIPLPGKLILLSPWLDLEMNNPAIESVNLRDPYLNVKALKMAGTLWAGETPLSDWHMSPVRGDLTGLPPIILFTGTDDILNPDAVTFKEKTTALNIHIDYQEYQFMIHDWMFFDMPEAEDCIDEIVFSILEARVIVLLTNVEILPY